MPRTYRATVRGRPSDQALHALAEGVDLEDGRTAPARTRRLADGRVEIVLREGRNRQVRRMLEAVGHRVTALERVRFGDLRLGNLERGASRRLTSREIERLTESPP